MTNCNGGARPCGLSVLREEGPAYPQDSHSAWLPTGKLLLDFSSRPVTPSMTPPRNLTLPPLIAYVLAAPQASL